MGIAKAQEVHVEASLGHAADNTLVPLGERVRKFTSGKTVGDTFASRESK